MRCGTTTVRSVRTRPLDGGPRPLPGGHPDARLRRADRPERGRQPAPDDDPRRLPRRRRALRHRLPVRRRRRRVRLDHAAAGRPDERRQGRRLDAPAADPRDRARSRPSRSVARGRLAAGAEEIMKVKIDALDMTVLRGGAADIGDVGQGPRLPAPARRARGPRLLRRAQPDLPRRRVRRRRGRRSAASRSATGRRSTSRSRPPTRGSRSGSSPSARPARSGSRPTSTC